MNNVIVIPYRDRDEQLQFFLKNSVPLISQYLPETQFVIIEQKKGKMFNRGALLNIGFNLYKSKTEYFFTHDVDVNPTEKCIEEHYIKEVSDNDVLGIYTSYCNTLGGVIKIKNSTIHKINGFPNNIWGWGTEDKALQNRAEFYGVKKITNLMNDREHPEYLTRFENPTVNEQCDLQAKTNYHYNTFKNLDKHAQEEYIKSTGLNNLSYDIIESISITSRVTKYVAEI